MNLHVTNDAYGHYPNEIAKRIGSSEHKEKNVIVNLGDEAVIKHPLITYIKQDNLIYEQFVDGLKDIEKVIFHPYTFNSFLFIDIVIKKFPAVKVFWICWSYEIYNLPHVISRLYDGYSAKYISGRSNLQQKIKAYIFDKAVAIRGRLKIKKSYWQLLQQYIPKVNVFCSPLPTDFYYLKKYLPKNNIVFQQFAYLSLERIIPNLEDKPNEGSKIMVGHSSSPDGNHFEIIQQIFSSIGPNREIFLPLSYGDMQYRELIIDEAKKRFSNLEILTEKLEISSYYKKLTEIGWAVINVKVQQGIGNIMGLLWMGAKVFLDKNSSTYIDFANWGIHIYCIQDDLNIAHLNSKLSPAQVEENRFKMLNIFGEQKVAKYWQPLIS